MAGKVKEKYPDDVETETVYSGFLGMGHKGKAVAPPNIAVGDRVLGGNASLEEIERAVLEKLNRL